MSIALLGIPFDASSSYLRGAAQAPKAIREALHCDASNMWTEDGVDLGQHGALVDLGDLDVPEDPEAAGAAIEAGVRAGLDLGHPLICLGGDHSITYPIIKAFNGRFDRLTILHFDAHPDLYDALDGNRLSHACPFARIMEAGLVRRLVQVGIRTLNGHQRDQADRFGVEIVAMQNIVRLHAMELDGPLYISLDLDVLDPAFAPGVSHYEPGGMSVREVLSVIQSIQVAVVGADIVEYNPTRDCHSLTAMVAAKALKEIASAIHRGEALIAKDL
jgi:arginase